MSKRLTLQLILPVRKDDQSEVKAMAAEDYYRKKGFHVNNPHRIAREVNNSTGYVHEGRVQAMCLHYLADADLVIIMPGWEYSDGSVMEIAFATEHGIPLYYHKSNMQVFFNTRTEVFEESQVPGDILTPDTILNGKEVKR